MEFYQPGLTQTYGAVPFAAAPASFVAPGVGYVDPLATVPSFVEPFTAMPAFVEPYAVPFVEPVPVPVPVVQPLSYVEYVEAPVPVVVPPPPPPPPMPVPIAEPLEEVGYKTRPPLLEDVSIEGPLRVPIPHALDTLEQRDAIEEDYNWWRYSRFAAPWLIFLLLMFILIFISTAFQQVGDVGELRNGTPRYYQFYRDSELPLEAGVDKDVRNLRISALFLTILPAVLAFLVLFLKPRPNLRKLLMFLYAFMLFCGAVLLFVAFGIGESDTDIAHRRHELDFLTNERPERRVGVETFQEAVTILLAFAALIAAIALVATTISGHFKLLRTGWRQQERDLEYEKPRPNKFNIRPYRVRRTRIALTSTALIVVILLGILLTTLIVIRHQDHPTIHLRNRFGRTSRFFEIPATHGIENEGWDETNTRLRYSWSALGILTVFLNLIPWRSRIIAWLFAFVYFAIAVMAMVSFGLDVHDLREGRHSDCPELAFQNLTPAQAAILRPWNTKLNCIVSPYVNTAVWEFIITVAIIIYLLFEYIIRVKSSHSQRRYTVFEIRKIERELDSRRPVRCELTSQVMTAKEYYYRHRFLAGSGHTAMAVPLAEPFVGPYY